MKLLMFQAQHFEFKHPSTDQTARGETTSETLNASTRETTVVFVHAEAEDLNRATALLTKAAKNIKWIANKRNLKAVALHSFAHLSESKAPRAFAESFITSLADRLRGNGYEVTITPFGHSLEWELRVFPEGIAKVFKSL